MLLWPKIAVLPGPTENWNCKSWVILSANRLLRSELISSLRQSTIWQEIFREEWTRTGSLVKDTKLNVITWLANNIFKGWCFTMLPTYNLVTLNRNKWGKTTKYCRVNETKTSQILLNNAITPNKNTW